MALYNLDCKNLFIVYKSKTEVLFVYNISFNLSKKAKVKYKPKDKPTVTKEI